MCDRVELDEREEKAAFRSANGLGVNECNFKKIFLRHVVGVIKISILFFSSRICMRIHDCESIDKTVIIIVVINIIDIILLPRRKL